MLDKLILSFLNKRLDKQIKRPPQNKKTLRKIRQEDYKKYLKTDHWKETRAEALRRGNYKCNDCGATKSLQVHHLTYARRGHELQSDLVVVCANCHKKRHGIKS